MNGLRWRLTGVVMAWVLVAPLAEAANVKQEVDRYISGFHQKGLFNGTVLVANERGILLKKGYGAANLEWKVPNAPDTKFRIGSITKSFTATVILQLAAEGKLQLDDPITKHLPDYRKDTGDRVTITHLLNHTSGIPSYTSKPAIMKDADGFESVAAFVKKACSDDLEFEPGTKYAYNNSGYFLLGAIIEKLTGQTYAEAVQARILGPLGMKDTGYDVSATVLPKRASGYAQAPGGIVNAAWLDMNLPYAAGSLYSTVEDLYRWERAFHGDTLLPAALKQKMLTPGLAHYGFGWVMSDMTLHDGKTKLPGIFHTGGINGFSSILVRVPERKEAVILLDNMTHGGLQELAGGVLSILHGLTPRPARMPIGNVMMESLGKGSVAQAIATYRTLKKTKQAEYDFSERHLNTVGYHLLRSGRAADAIEVFKLNVEMFPEAANCHDSLGEAYAAHGDKARAITSYRKALELAPKNEHAVKMLEQLEEPAAKR
ncbi:serine hydrolase domain-containing protein [Corallococcus macrosporus]|uniref:Beta-lactamase n=1 Tax=Myxococcus fulvus (strain ATCC BAA-855 / HW-1) TaxID=483219 RepID=F8CAF0_MYXFH|nr:serine hydrolase domain-containing protein [Corallococcus macrosporus]AEI65808.1 beta-lactamase [Corallococcus macrosporus]